MREIFETLQQGGWSMILLGICSLTALTIIIERFFALRRASVIDPVVVDVIEEYVGESSAETAARICRSRRGALARVVEEAVHVRRRDAAHVREAVAAAAHVQLGRLGRGLTVLEIIANVSPLIGLLGTVLGMHTVFKAITAQGIGNPQVLSEGISEALITTIAGLCVAIPALACHSWFSQRVDDLAAEMRGHVTKLLAKLQVIDENAAGAAADAATGRREIPVR
ncbi:MAG TPA: MotA/TolQ/ExbB proton channel family protein [Candidatus Hydrogenedentes bacterium]|nr:MotA/TolQ/ExbB proton channel family protein [Zoogloea sp.]HPG65532.1 MotA/TolQ/ExbB proton channel family protein [Candidatus Hydrogenedentota bacterium]